jgi:hypothetical protein
MRGRSTFAVRHAHTGAAEARSDAHSFAQDRVAPMLLGLPWLTEVFLPLKVMAATDGALPNAPPVCPGLEPIAREFMRKTAHIISLAVFLIGIASEAVWRPW